MGPRDVTSPDAVVRAMEEHDELGREEFLAKYGFRRATKFVVVHDGKEYDSKALLAAAHGFQHPDQGPLPNNFSGGNQTTARLQAMGFTVSTPVPATPSVQFSREDCAVFQRYPKPVHWDAANIPPEDQAKFKAIWERLKELATWLAEAAQVTVPLRPFTSHYLANGFSHKQIWCCVYPFSAPNKSYTLQVLLIISASGAELSICLGAGRSQLRGPKLAEAERALKELQARLAAIPPDVAGALADALPGNVSYRKSWLQPAGTRDFETVTDWLAYAASSTGAGASISRNIDADELDQLGTGVGSVFLELAEAAAPLFEYCFPPGEPLPAPDEDITGQPTAKTVTIGGVTVGKEEIAHAISVLKSTGGTAVKAPLQVQGNPLADMNYHEVAEHYLQDHPELEIPPGSHGQHSAHVKTALVACLQEHLENFSESEPASTGHVTVPVRPMSFDAETLENLAVTDSRELEIGQRVYRAIAAAIRSGKHVILTGPPGTAKTTIAELVCELATSAGLCSGYTLTTATSDWTTYETIGGLRPAGSGSALNFREGLFLEAARAGRWLIVDELNRSNFDRAFGQMFTVLSGQAVALPYEDPANGRRIALIPEGAAGSYDAADYSLLEIPRSWRIIATMNVFDKSLLFEMSFALMRRFAFIEVPSPPAAVFAKLWRGELAGLPDALIETAERILSGLLALRSAKDIGPAVFLDMARFSREYLRDDMSGSAQDLAFQLFYSYLLPQFEGITSPQGAALFKKVRPLVGNAYQERLRSTLTEVLGVALPSAQAADDDVESGLETDANSSFDTAPDPE